MLEWQTRQICAFIGMAAQAWMEIPKGQRNPLLEAAERISIDGRDDEHDWADDGGFQEEDMPPEVREARDKMAQRMRTARERAEAAPSYDEAVAAERREMGSEAPVVEIRRGSSRRDPGPRRGGMPPMPKVPVPTEKFDPFPVDEDGNVIGVPIARPGDPPGALTEEEEAALGEDLAPGGAEAIQKIFIPR